MIYQFNFRLYSRKFKQPLATSHGLWSTREGIIIRLKDEGDRASFGEIAPIPWFGSETFVEARDFCTNLSEQITEEEIFGICSHLPACQYGFESAWENLMNYPQPLEGIICPSNKGGTRKRPVLKNSGLLPGGESALSVWEDLWEKGYETFKWKIGVKPLQEELEIFDRLLSVFPPQAKLRLDANGGLSFAEAQKWLSICEGFTQVEFIEQPLLVSEFKEMLTLAEVYSTPIALDESVANVAELFSCYQKGWRGIFVVKPGIAGSPRWLRHFCQDYKEVDVVFSSALETVIGGDFALKLAAELNKNERAVGFGVDHWFEEDGFSSGDDFLDIWNRL